MARAGLRLLLFVVVGIVAGCESVLIPIPGTTTRVTEPRQSEGKELRMELFVRPDQCSRASIPQNEYHLLPIRAHLGQSQSEAHWRY